MIVICISAGIVTSLIASWVHKPTFTAAALISVNQAEDDGTGHAGDASVDTQITMLQSPAFIEHAFSILSRDDAIAKWLHRPEDLERGLKVSQMMRSRLVSIAFSAKSREAAAEIANRIARLYVEDPLLQGLQSIDDASEVLVERIAGLEARLRAYKPRAEKSASRLLRGRKRQGLRPSRANSDAEGEPVSGSPEPGNP